MPTNSPSFFLSWSFLRSSALEDNTLFNLHNSSYHTQPHPITDYEKGVMAPTNSSSFFLVRRKKKKKGSTKDDFCYARGLHVV